MGNLISFYTEIAVELGVCAACIDGYFKECGRLDAYLSSVPVVGNAIPLACIELERIYIALGGVFAVSEIVEALQVLDTAGYYHVKICDGIAYVGHRTGV